MADLAREIVRVARSHSGYDTYTSSKLTVYLHHAHAATQMSVLLCRKTTGAVVAFPGMWTVGIEVPSDKQAALRLLPFKQVFDKGMYAPQQSDVSITLEAFNMQDPNDSKWPGPRLHQLVSFKLRKSDCGFESSFSDAIWECISTVNALEPGPLETQKA